MNNVMQKVLNLATATAITMAIGAPMQVSAADFTLKITGANSRTLPATRAEGEKPTDRLLRAQKHKQSTRSYRPAAEDISVIVHFKVRWQPEGNLGSNVERQRQRAQLKRAGARFIARLKRYKPRDIRTYKTLPFVAMTVDRRTYTMLSRRPDVVSVQPDEQHMLTLGSSLPVVGANNVQASGYRGEGQTVVIIDTGVDTNNPNFTPGQVVSQSCFNPGTVAFGNGESRTNLCPTGGATSTSLTGQPAINQNAGDDICGPPVGAVGTCEHGTHVASIAAGTNGVAPEANIIAMQVFALLQNAPPAQFAPGQPFGPPAPRSPLPPPNTPICGAGTLPNAQCLRTYSQYYLSALDETAVLAESFDIAAVNMSLGNGASNNGACDIIADGSIDARALAIDNLFSLGIATVVAAGNDGFINGINAPACFANAISVGNTTDADAVNNGSNVANILDLHAPGTLIVGGAPVNSPCDNGFGANGDGQCRMTGTSQAAPHVTGAWAALKSLNPAARVEDVLAILQGTGNLVSDTRANTVAGFAGTGIQIPRIQLDLAMERFDPHRGSIATGDFNCDGRQDIAMGSPNQTVNNKADAGEVSILYGSSKGAVPFFNRHINQNSKDKFGKKAEGGAEAGDRFGHSLATGDFNNDGCDDLAVGVPFESIGTIKAGLVQVFYGKPWGFDMNMDQLWHQNSAGVAGGVEDGDKFGWSLAVGDFNNDGLDDLAIGTPTESIGTVPASGAVTVIYGHGAGLDAYDSQIWHQDNLPLSVEAGDLFGYAITTGYFNNDQYSDLAIGAPRETSPTIDDSGADAGAVTVLYGSANGVKTSGWDYFHQGKLVGTLEAGDGFGFSLTSGNFNNDKYSDLVIGAPFENLEYTNSTVENAGIVHVIRGSFDGLTLTGNTMWHQNTASIKGASQADDYFGYSVASGDFNKDGFDDLAVGAPFEDIGSTKIDAGAVNVILGSNNGGLTTVGNQIWYQNVSKVEGFSESFDRFGEAVAVGNIKTGTPYVGPDGDLAVRVSGEDIATSESGAVQIFYAKSGIGLNTTWDKLIKLEDF